jgi:hypothetical protein
MPVLRGHRKRQFVVAAIVVVCLGLFTLEWTNAPRVQASPSVTRQLPALRGELFLGRTFEGLPLRRVRPFLYSDCAPGKRRTIPVRCRWVKVEHGRVTGRDPKQVARATRKLRPVG